MRGEGTAHHKRCQDEILAQDTSVCNQIPSPTIDLRISEQQVEPQLLQSPLEIPRKYCLCFYYLLSILLCLTPLMPASYRLLKVLLPLHFPFTLPPLFMTVNTVMKGIWGLSFLQEMRSRWCYLWKSDTLTGSPAQPVLVLWPAETTCSFRLTPYL